ncbi:MAG: hypothetical protein EOO48_04355 [Flavobacterium sp.]|nr:MAG: hypothetical protein EOO48_04355 [Flavobacterium sp.]
MDDFFRSQSKTTNIITIAYFIVAVCEIMSELFYYTPLIVICKPLMPILLIVLYWFTSSSRQTLFMIALLLSSVTNILFIPNEARMLFFGIIVFTIHRIIVIFFIFRLIKISDYIPVAIATVPFLIVFSYMLVSSDVPENSFLLLIVQNVLISVLGGISVANYVMNDNRRNSWLLICGILFVALQFIVFVEKYFLIGISPGILRPIAMALNAFAFYTFYEFVLAVEKSDDNGATA